MVDTVLVKAFGEFCKVGQVMSAVVTTEEGFGAGGRWEDETDFYPVIFSPLKFYWLRKGLVKTYSSIPSLLSSQFGKLLLLLLSILVKTEI